MSTPSNQSRQSNQCLLSNQSMQRIQSAVIRVHTHTHTNTHTHTHKQTHLFLLWLCCRDVYCGRIQCQGGRERPLLGTNAEILTTTVRFNHSDLVCRGTFFHLGDDVSDPATVAQGTACGPGKVRECPRRPGGGVDENK